jgi:hypothetical protein
MVSLEVVDPEVSAIINGLFSPWIHNKMTLLRVVKRRKWGLFGGSTFLSFTNQ